MKLLAILLATLALTIAACTPGDQGVDPATLPTATARAGDDGDDADGSDAADDPTGDGVTNDPTGDGVTNDPTGDGVTASPSVNTN